MLYDQLDDDQRAFVDLALTGENIFLTGSAGVGKTFVIKALCEKLKENNRNFRLTATTGIAAIQIGGITINNLLKCGLANKPIIKILEIFRNNQILKNEWASIETLIIDEVSMLQPRMFRIIRDYAIEAKSNRSLPFGGIQIIAIGDFAQLPCVMTKNDRDQAIELSNQYGPAEADNLNYSFVFKHPIWKQTFKYYVYLRNIHRQNDIEFISLLNRIRLNELVDDDHRLLYSIVRKTNLLFSTVSLSQSSSSSLSPSSDIKNENENTLLNIKEIKPTAILSKNDKVDQENLLKLRELCPDESKHLIYEAVCHKEGNLKNPLANNVYEQFFQNMKRNCLAPSVLSLVIGLDVMLITNLKIDEGLANGSRGKIIGFTEEKHEIMPNNSNYPMKQLPIVEFENGKIKKIEYWKWSAPFRFPNSSACYYQIPLRPAYAISIHKSQGLTINKIYTELNDLFADGQAYVALSRAKSLDGLYIGNYDRTAIKTSREVKNLYKKIEKHVQKTNSPVISLTPIPTPYIKNLKPQTIDLIED